MRSSSKVSVAVVGASGYTGGEVLRLLSQHPIFEVRLVTSEKSAGLPVVSSFPHLNKIITLSFEHLAPEILSDRVDAVFLCLPHTKSIEPAAICYERGKPVVDLSADYRLKSRTTYESWYGTPHTRHDLLPHAVYGLPELHRSAIAQARLVASPGCYPTAAILQFAPLAAHGLLIPQSLIIDAKSGVSGAGRSPALAFHFPEANESLEPYKIGKHRHIPEIEQELNLLAAAAPKQSPSTEMPTDLMISFTPHLVPMNRGILSTGYCRLQQPRSLADLRTLYREYYQTEPFVRVLDDDLSPNPRHVRGSNFCDVNVFLDTRTGVVITVAAIDNLVKGAAGQAIQAMNLMFNLPETTGLMAPGLMP
jgi:N-acetyl-gamma-glutamyl-phosphate reductase